MNEFLEKNPLGAVLLGLTGALMLLGLGLTWLWGDSGALDADAAADAAGMALPDSVTPRELGGRGEYEVIVNRPIFNETRRPIVIVEPPPVEPEPEPVPEVVVADPPKVRLTGVVITPTERVVTLTPERGGDALVIREGMPLDGEYVGWQVDAVNPRTVSLRSAQGQSVEFELTVHDTAIARPPEPKPAASAAPAEGADPAAPDDLAESGTRSRADEIRDRIRQRREQLRAEADEQAEAEADAQENRASAYTEAIQSMIQGGRSRNADNEDSGDSDEGSGDNR